MKPDGGPAFPVQVDEATMAHGLSVRDYFAAAALGAIVGNSDYLRNARGIPGDDFVHVAYELADAMLAEREKP